MDLSTKPSGLDVSSSTVIDAVHSMLKKYTDNFPSHNLSPAAIPGLPLTDKILVTGARIGLHYALLSLLSETPEVESVYAVDTEYEVPLL
jgi:hypothetical protein